MNRDFSTDTLGCASHSGHQTIFGMWQRLGKVFGLENASASSPQENHPEPSEFGHPENRSLFDFFTQNSRWDVTAQQYETRTHPDLAEILFDLSPDPVVRKGMRMDGP